MKVVLLKSVDNLGAAGEAVNVKRGYFRNYLEPRRIALIASPENIEFVESKREELAAMVAKETQDASSVKDRLESLELHFQLLSGESGRLFGSVTAKDVLTRIKDELGLEIERRKVEMENLKTLGEHDVRIRVYPGVVAHVKVLVERLAGENEEEYIEDENILDSMGPGFADADDYDDEFEGDEAEAETSAVAAETSSEESSADEAPAEDEPKES